MSSVVKTPTQEPLLSKPQPKNPFCQNPNASVRACDFPIEGVTTLKTYMKYVYASRHGFESQSVRTRLRDYCAYAWRHCATTSFPARERCLMEKEKITDGGPRGKKMLLHQGKYLFSGFSSSIRNFQFFYLKYWVVEFTLVELATSLVSVLGVKFCHENFI